MQVTAFLGLGSRYSYLASTQIERIEGATDATFEWIPINSVELIRRSRTGGSPFDEQVLEGQYDPAFRDLDVRRWAKLYGVPYHAPDISALPPDVLAVVCWCLPQPEERRSIMAAFFDAIFARGEAMDLDVVRSIAADFGMSASMISDALNGGGAEVRHEEALAQALAKGVFGVPSFMIRDALFWGNDRLPLLEDHLSATVDG